MNDAPAPIERAVLAGYLRIIDPPPGFVVPLFRAPELSGADCAPSYLIQEIDAEQTITGFTPLAPGGGDVVAAAQPAEKRVGEPCVLGYELSPGNVVSGTHAELRARLRGCVNEAGLRERPFARWEVADFCGLEDTLTAIAREVRGKAGHSRSLAFFGNGVLAKSCVRARLAAAAGGPSLPAGAFHIVERDGALAIAPGEGLSAEMHAAVSGALAEFVGKEIKPLAGGGGAVSPLQPIKLFYSYSHRDERFREKIENQLKILQRRGVIAQWHDRKIAAGTEWVREIDAHLDSAEIILLLVSAHFLASEYCWGKEMVRALERHDANEARVIPIILQPCLWQDAPFAKLQAVPKDGKPVTAWADPDMAFQDVVAAIERVVEDLRTQRARAVAAAMTAAPAVVTARADVVVHIGVDPRNLPDLAVFKDVDAPWCPEMVVIPAGEFLMGSPQTEQGHYDNEGPLHRVTIGTRFALGRYPVTFDEYDHFCAATRREKPKDRGWGRGRRPVINVSWEDAVAYCAWLARKTGQRYRLPSEAEWEYACRAGTTTRYSVGDEITEKDANFDWKLGETTEVGACPANPWALYDMHGNVLEWCEDVSHGSYEGAPVDGSAWVDRAGAFRVLRGGSWLNGARGVRSAYRLAIVPGNRYNSIGFRCARVQGS